MQYRWHIDKVTSFKYLGSIITSDGLMEAELRARLAKAGSCFGAMNKFMCSKGNVRIETKLKVLNCVIVPIIMYGCESWNVTKAAEGRLDVIEMRWLRSMLRITIQYNTIQ